MKKLFAKTRAWREKGGVRPWLYLPFVFFAYAILDVCLRYTYRGYGMLGFAHPAAHLLTAAWCLILTGIACLLPGRFKKGYLILTVLLFAVLTAAHSVLRNLFSRFFMFSTLAFAGDGMAFADSQYIQLAPLVIAALALALLSLVMALILAPGKGEGKLVAPLIVCVLMAVAGIAVILFCHKTWLTAEDNTKLEWDNYADPALVYENFTDSTATLLMAGLYQYTARDLVLTLNIGGGITEEERAELDTFVAKRRATQHDNDYTGLLAGKNVILIQLEAIDTWMLTAHIMPNLWALKEESLVFENHYTPAYITAGTLNTEFMVNTGLVPATGNVSTSVYQRNSYPFSFANQLRSAGYSTQSFHGSEGNIYSRAAFHPAVGYETYNSGNDMGMEDYTMDSDLMVAYEDIVRKGDEPFMSFIITYSGHGPYNVGTGAFLAHRDRAEEFTPEDSGNYIFAVAGAMETDAFIGALIERMEADGSIDDTVLIFYADHYNYYMMHDGLSKAIKGIEDTDEDDMNLLTNTDFFIYAKDREPESVTKYTSSLDVLPTLSNLFGLDDEGAVYMGHDAFNDEGGWVFFSDSSWLDEETYWHYGSATAEGAVARGQEIADFFRMGNLLLLSDFFAHNH